MNDSGDQPLSALDRRDNRRWLIGVGISVTFGLFGVVMALLSYSHRTAAAPPAAGASPGAPRAEGNRPAGRTRTAEPADRERKPRNRQ